MSRSTRSTSPPPWVRTHRTTATKRTQVSIRVVRLGSPRLPQEGLRLGTVRRPPRGVKKDQYAQRNFYDAWVPELAPSAPLVARALSRPFSPQRWRAFARGYRSEMRAPQSRRLIELLAAISHQTNFSVGCYCEDASHCHRSLLKDLLIEAGASVEQSVIVPSVPGSGGVLMVTVTVALSLGQGATPVTV